MKKESITPYGHVKLRREREKEVKRKRRELSTTDPEYDYLKLALAWFRKTQVEKNDGIEIPADMKPIPDELWLLQQASGDWLSWRGSEPETKDFIKDADMIAVQFKPTGKRLKSQ